MVNPELCLGKEACGLCKKACPYGGPQFGAETDARMQMCHFCVDRWQEHRKPVCVEACPMRALDAGPLDEMVVKYGALKEVNGFACTEKNKPSVMFRARAPELLR